MKRVVCLVSILAFSAFAGGLKICWEAEDSVSLEAPMVVCANTPDGTSGKALEIPEGAGNPPKLCKGKAVYEVEVPEQGGNFTFWARVLWNGECSNSFTVSVDGATPFLFGEDATYKKWHWVRYPMARTAKPIKLEGGKHKIEINNREDGIWIDQILLSADKRFVPVDIEKPGVRQ